MALWLNLAELLAFLGLTGCVLAVASALIAAVAFGIGNATGGGIAIVGWLTGLTLSLCGSSAGNWTLSALAVAVVPLALIVAGAAALLRTIQLRRSARSSV